MWIILFDRRDLLMLKYKVIILCLMPLSIMNSYAMHCNTASGSNSVNLSPVTGADLPGQYAELVRDADFQVKVLLSSIPLIPTEPQKNEVIRFVKRLQSCFSQGSPDVARLHNVLQEGDTIYAIVDKLDKKPSSTDARIHNIALSTLSAQIINQEDEDQNLLGFGNSTDSTHEDLRALRKRADRQIEALRMLYTKESNEFHKCLIRDHLTTIPNYQNSPQKLRRILDISSKLHSYLSGDFFQPEIAHCFECLRKRLSGRSSDIDGLRNMIKDCDSVCAVMNTLNQKPSPIDEKDGNIVESTLVEWMLDREDTYRTIFNFNEPVCSSRLDDKSYGDQRIPDSNDPIYFSNPKKNFRELRERSDRQKNALLALYAEEFNKFHKRMIGDHLNAIENCQSRPQELHEALDMASSLQSYLEGKEDIVLHCNNKR